MIKKNLITISQYLLGASLLCGTILLGTKISVASEMDDLYTQSGKKPVLNSTDNMNLQSLRQWEGSGVRALQGTTVNSKGQLVFTYGAQTPSLVCSILQVSDIELEPGEKINSVNLGDNSRWSVEAAISGTQSGEDVQHILVKPLDIALETSMVILTDRRTYRLKLKSTDKEYMPSIAFSYPEKIQAQIEAQQALLAKDREDHSITTELNGKGSKTYLGDLNFKYEIEGNVSWRPIRVFDDGHKTIIEMPEHMLARTAPSLLILEDEGGWFSDEKTSIINYRLQGTRYVVDGLFETAILTMDVGDDQQRVVITREEGL